MGWGERFSKSTRVTLHFRGDLTASTAGRGSTSTNITTPLLITDPETSSSGAGSHMPSTTC
jgi:hypothetical protein